MSANWSLSRKNVYACSGVTLSKLTQKMEKSYYNVKKLMNIRNIILFS